MKCGFELCLLLLLLSLLAFTRTNAFNVTNATQNTCSGSKQLYRDMACCGGNPNYEAVCMPKVVVTPAPAPAPVPANETYQHGTLQAFCNELSTDSEIGINPLDLNASAIGGSVKPLYVHRHNASVCEWRSLHWNPNGTMTRFFMFLNETTNRTSGTVLEWNVQQNTSVAYAVGVEAASGGNNGTSGSSGGRRSRLNMMQQVECNFIRKYETTASPLPSDCRSVAFSHFTVPTYVSCKVEPLSESGIPGSPCYQAIIEVDTSLNDKCKKLKANNVPDLYVGKKFQLACSGIASYTCPKGKSCTLYYWDF